MRNMLAMIALPRSTLRSSALKAHVSTTCDPVSLMICRKLLGQYVHLASI